MDVNDIVFGLCCAVSVVAGLLTVSRRNPIHSALSLLVCFLAFAVLYLTLDAPFLAALHVLVYTGAILVLFLFVIMLLNLRGEDLGGEMSKPVKGILAALCAALAAAVILLFVRSDEMSGVVRTVDKNFGGVEEVGREMFGGYILHFELVGILLLVAMIGAMILAKKKIGNRESNG